MSGKSLIILILTASVAVGGAGAGYYAWHRRQPMVRAEQAMARGQLREAVLQLRTVVRDDPRNTTAHLMMAQAHSRLGDLLSAERDLKRARALGADRWEIVGQLGLYYLADRRFKEVLAEVPSTGPTPAIGARNLALRSRALTGLNDLKGAAATLEAATKLDPGNAEVKVAAARLALAARDTGKAMADLDAALAVDRGNLEALLLKSQMLAAQGKLPDAVQVADRAVEASPGLPTPRLHRAGLLLTVGELEKARADVNDVLAAQPRNATALYLDGVLDLRENSAPAAAERFANLGPTAPRFPRAPYFQAQAALGQNLASTAVEAATRYATQTPDDPAGIRLLARAQAADRRADQGVATLTAAVARGIDDAQTLDMLGSMLALVGDLDRAEDAYRRALAKAPGSPVILVHVANLRLQRGDPAAALKTLDPKTFEQTAQTNDQQAELLQTTALAQIAAGDTDAAAETLAKLRAAAGQTETTGMLAGTLALARFDTEAAVAAFGSTAQAFPDSTVAALNFARALTASGRRDQARTVLLELLAKDPRNVPALTSFVQLEAAAGRYGGAIKSLEAARTASPADDGILALMSDVLVRAGDPARAIATIQRARQSDRRPPLVLNALARAQAAARQPDEAERSYQTALADGPNASTSLALADVQEARGDAPRARTTLDAAIAASPGRFDLLTRRVELETRTAGAPAGLAKAEALRKDEAQMQAAAVLVGDALTRANRPADAVRAFRQEWEAAPTAALAVRLADAQAAAGDDAGAMRTLATVPSDLDGAVVAAQIAIRAGRWPDAARSLELALRGRPDDAGLTNNLAVAYQRTKDGRARATAQRAYLLAPTPDASDTLGWIMVEQGAAAEALPILRQAAEKRPTDPGIAYHLAAALVAAGRPAEAVPLLKAALSGPQRFEENADASSLLAKIAQR